MQPILHNSIVYGRWSMVDGRQLIYGKTPTGDNVYKICNELTSVFFSHCYRLAYYSTQYICDNDNVLSMDAHYNHWNIYAEDFFAVQSFL